MTVFQGREKILTLYHKLYDEKVSSVQTMPDKLFTKKGNNSQLNNSEYF